MSIARTRNSTVARHRSDEWLTTNPPSRRAVELNAGQLRGYVVAVGLVAVAIAATRSTWPLLARTPFVPLFAAIFAAARWLPTPASRLAVAAGVAAAFLVPDVDVASLVLFVGIAWLVNHMVVGRNDVEQALRASEAQFRAAWEHAAFGAALVAPNGQITRINPAMELTLGYPGAAWVGVPHTYFSADPIAGDRDQFRALMAGTGPVYQREQRYRCADGRIIWCRMTMSAIRGAAAGLADGGLMVLEDITEPMVLRERLARVEATAGAAS